MRTGRREPSPWAGTPAVGGGAALGARAAERRPEQRRTSAAGGAQPEAYATPALHYRPPGQRRPSLKLNSADGFAVTRGNRVPQRAPCALVGCVLDANTLLRCRPDFPLPRPRFTFPARLPVVRCRLQRATAHATSMAASMHRPINRPIKQTQCSSKEIAIMLFGPRKCVPAVEFSNEPIHQSVRDAPLSIPAASQFLIRSILP